MQWLIGTYHSKTDGRDIAWEYKGHSAWKKAAFDARQGIFLPQALMSAVMKLQADLMVDYSNKAANSAHPDKSNYWISVNRIYCNQMTVRSATVEKGALWRVTAVHGHSTFYSEIPLNSSSTETTVPQEFKISPHGEAILFGLPTKK